MEEVFQRSQEAMGSGDAAQWQMMLVAQRAIGVGLQTLEKIATDGPRYELSEGGINQETGQVDMPEKLHNTDLEAAKALAKLGIDAAKLSMGFMATRQKVQAGAMKRVGPGSQNDLFDIPNPWQLEQTENH